MPPPYPTDTRALQRDTDVETFTAGGPGGQHRNKTANAVRLHHRPSGLRVTGTERRSLVANLRAAFERLERALAKANHVPEPRRATRVPPREKRHRTDEKTRTGERKRTRTRVGMEE
ncbi:MAG: peptide chain release factor-like protein [Myxococcales bacterium]|nr:peptide chain release factor-like protein [Myxococcales bacterium]